jgi:hypothetical protein
MVNFWVADLTALLEHLRGNGVEILREESAEGIGDFAG